MTADLDTIRRAYAAATNRALAAWDDDGDAGPPAPLPYDERALAYAYGSLLDPPASLAPVLDAIESIAARDATVRPVPRASLHFTFLAVTLLWARVRLEVVKSRIARAEEDAIDLGLDDRTET